MIYIAEIFLAAFNIWMASVHSKLIKKGITPKHGWWGLSYAAALALFCILNKSWLLVIAGALIRKIVFDISLNLFRGLPVFYVSSSSTSIIDKIHNNIFGKRSEIYMAIYASGLITIQFLL